MEPGSDVLETDCMEDNAGKMFRRTLEKHHRLSACDMVVQ